MEVLRSSFITQGLIVPRFEKAVADYCDAKYAVAVNSATSALHLACLALGVGKDDIVWTSPITFVASANCALYCGAKIDFVDIDPETYNISVSVLKKKLAQAKKTNTLPKVIIPVHLSGQSCDMEEIHALGKKYNFKIIEDASHAIGAKYKGEPVGNNRYCDITIFSFHPVKIITTGEGGLASTNSIELAKRMTLLRSHGITRDESLMTEATHGEWYYQQIELGYNYRMTDIQAALGLSQLKRVDEFVSKRHHIAERYTALLSDLPLTMPKQIPDSYSGLHLFIIRLKLEFISKSHREVVEMLRKKGIGVNVHYIPVHLQPYYYNMGFRLGDFLESELYYADAISLPIFPTLSEKEQSLVIDEIKKVLS